MASLLVLTDDIPPGEKIVVALCGALAHWS
jgi:hypothetical protein